MSKILAPADSALISGQATALSAATRPTLRERLARSAVHARLERLVHGRVIIRAGGEERSFGQPTSELPLTVTVEVCRPSLWTATALGGTVGVGEAYMDGDWTCDDLTGLVRIFVRNRAVMEGMERGWARLTAPLRALFHLVNRNSLGGSRRNIAAHYDLGNELFALFLDPTMMYSCAWFPRADSTLEEAAVAKLDRICAKLELKPTDHLLEIGSGWGGFAIHAARHYGCRVTTTTISQRQQDLAVKRVRAAGLDDKVTVLLKDYRELDGRYDKLVSIEMIEAVGHQFYDTYFAACSRLLKDDGVMLLQSITIADQLYRQALGEVDFIQRHIFPGSCIPSLTALTGSLTRASDLRVTALDDLTPHYARTLELWRQRFLARRDAVLALGYDQRFVRMWEFYLCYCAGGFSERTIGTVHLLLAKPGWRQPEQAWWN